MKADWSRWSRAIIRLLEQLHFAVPVHVTKVKWAACRSNTIRAAIDAGLVAEVSLVEEGHSIGMPFLRLTREGQAVKRDWIQFNRAIVEATGQYTAPEYRRAAEQRL